MLEEYEKQKRKRLATMRSLMDYGMGFIILVIGLVLLPHSRGEAREIIEAICRARARSCGEPIWVERRAYLALQ